MFIASALSEVFPATLIMMAIAIGGFFIIFKVRKSLKDPKDQSMPFSLHALKKLRDEGSISVEEYEKASQAVIDAAKSGTSDIHKDVL